MAPPDGPDQSQTVIVTATDSDGASSTTSFELIVDNVAPEIDVNEDEVVVDEASTADNSGSFDDPGDDDVTITASIGTVTQDSGNSGNWSWSYEAGDGPIDSQTVTVTATDSDGAATSTTFELVVENVDPNIETIAVDPNPADPGRDGNAYWYIR